MSDPSHLQVDRWVATGDDDALAPLRAAPDWAAHLAAVERPPEEVPPWVSALARPEAATARSPAGRGRARWRLVVPLALAACLVAAIGAWAVLRGGEPGGYVAVKGGASAVVYVRTEASGQVWTGAPLAAGDAIRIALADVGAPWWAIVYRTDDGEPPTVLATGHGDGLVAGAWTLDRAGAGSELVVVGSDEEPAPDDAEALLALPVEVVVRLR